MIHKKYSLRFWTLICEEAKKRDLYHSDKMDEAHLNRNEKEKVYHREQMRKYIRIHAFAVDRKKYNEGLIKGFLTSRLCSSIEKGNRESLINHINSRERVYRLFDRFIRFPFSWYIEKKILESEYCKKRVKSDEKSDEYVTPKWLKERQERQRKRAKGSAVTAKTEKELMDKLESAMDVRNDYDRLNPK